MLLMLLMLRIVDGVMELGISPELRKILVVKLAWFDDVFSELTGQVYPVRPQLRRVAKHRRLPF